MLIVVSCLCLVFRSLPAGNREGCGKQARGARPELRREALRGKARCGRILGSCWPRGGSKRRFLFVRSTPRTQLCFQSWLPIFVPGLRKDRDRRSLQWKIARHLRPSLRNRGNQKCRTWGMLRRFARAHSRDGLAVNLRTRIRNVGSQEALLIVLRVQPPPPVTSETTIAAESRTRPDTGRHIRATSHPRLRTRHRCSTLLWARCLRVILWNWICTLPSRDLHDPCAANVSARARCHLSGRATDRLARRSPIVQMKISSMPQGYCSGPVKTTPWHDAKVGIEALRRSGQTPCQIQGPASEPSPVWAAKVSV